MKQGGDESQSQKSSLPGNRRTRHLPKIRKEAAGKMDLTLRDESARRAFLDRQAIFLDSLGT